MQIMLFKDNKTSSIFKLSSELSCEPKPCYKRTRQASQANSCKLTFTMERPPISRESVIRHLYDNGIKPSHYKYDTHIEDYLLSYFGFDQENLSPENLNYFNDVAVKL